MVGGIFKKHIKVPVVLREPKVPRSLPSAGEKKRYQKNTKLTNTNIVLIEISIK